MASSYSSDLKLELMVTGENAGTWGDKTNTNLNLVQQAIAGFESVTLSAGGTTALVMSDGALSNARNLVIKFATITATSGTICTIPDSIEKFYIFDVTAVTNPTNLTIKTASGTGFTPDAQKIYAAYSDGTNLNEVSLDTLGGTIGTAQVADDAITNAKIADDAIRAAQISDNAVVTAGILDSNVTTAKIADDAVTADKLANTAVTAGTYTVATLTVDAQGRITSAASGSAGGAASLGLFARGPSSGTYTAQPGITDLYVYACGGGGGGAGSADGFKGRGGRRGGFGFFDVDVSAPFSQPYAVGGPGSGGPAGFGSVGGAGGDTLLGPGGNVVAAFGGTGGLRNSGSGTPGSVPGAKFDLSPVIRQNTGRSPVPDSNFVPTLNAASALSGTSFSRTEYDTYAPVIGIGADIITSEGVSLDTKMGSSGAGIGPGTGQAGGKGVLVIFEID